MNARSGILTVDWSISKNLIAINKDKTVRMYVRISQIRFNSHAKLCQNSDRMWFQTGPWARNISLHAEQSSTLVVTAKRQTLDGACTWLVAHKSRLIVHCGAGPGIISRAMKTGKLPSVRNFAPILSNFLLDPNFFWARLNIALILLACKNQPPVSTEPYAALRIPDRKMTGLPNLDESPTVLIFDRPS